MSRLATLHPYPAMIAEPLAEELADQFVRKGMNVLDPFCGTARTLLSASARGASCTGIDVNPLAIVLSRAKAGRLQSKRLGKLLVGFRRVKPGLRNRTFSPARKVVWISASNRRELWALIAAINRAKINLSEVFLISSVLSATVREVSMARKDCWKLHRLPPASRRKLRLNAIDVFCRRLQAVIAEVERRGGARLPIRVSLGDSRRLDSILAKNHQDRRFDLVVTSPPYGDSASTVQYGGMSGLCLEVIRNIRRLGLDSDGGVAIDRNCLGGRVVASHTSAIGTSDFWMGGRRNPAWPRVAQFLADMKGVCHQIEAVLKPGGRIIFVVGKRRVGGRVLRLDRFLVKVLQARGVWLQGFVVRRLKGKLVPSRVNRGGVGLTSRRKGSVVATMRDEVIMVFGKGERAV